MAEIYRRYARLAVNWWLCQYAPTCRFGFEINHGIGITSLRCP